MSEKKVEVVEFNGIRYRRYPESEYEADRKYFRASGADIKKGYGYLHRDKWEYYNGEIPEGHHVHHKDGNPGNNDIENLECLPGEKHLSECGYEGQSASWMAKIQDKAKEWHKSEEGRKWHKEHGKRVFENKEPEKLICEQCGEEFETKALGGTDKIKYCSNKCKSAARRESGVDDETRECIICGENFTTNKYSKAKTCSRKCAGKLQSKTKRAK